MKRSITGFFLTSVLVPFITFLAVYRDLALTSLLALPFTLVSYAILHIAFATVSKNKKSDITHKEFVYATLLAGLCCLFLSAAGVEIAYRYIPQLVSGVTLGNFNLMSFVLNGIIPTALYSMILGSVSWWVALRNLGATKVAATSSDTIITPAIASIPVTAEGIQFKKAANE